MNGLIRASLKNPHAVAVMALTIEWSWVPVDPVDPDRHPAGVQEPRGADADVLRRHAGGRRRQRHHQPDGALGRAGVGDEAAGVAIDRRREHRPQLFPG